MQIQLDFNEEIWKDILEFDGEYQISNFGRLYRKKRVTKSKNGVVKTIPSMYIIPQDNGKGYKQLCVTLNKKRRVFYVHRLVAIYFLNSEKTLERPEVNHKDFNRSNNHFLNLEWVSSKRNKEHAYEHGRYPIGEDSYRTTLTNKQVLEIREYHIKNPCILKSMVAKKYGVHPTVIHSIIKRTKWKRI